jgi:outer membrane protein assembly factor BamD
MRRSAPRQGAGLAGIRAAPIGAHAKPGLQVVGGRRVSFVYTSLMSAYSAGLRGLLLIPLMALVLVAGCQSNREQQRLAKLTPEALYQRGQKALRASDYPEAVKVYEALTARYPFTSQSRQGRLDIIFAYYRMGEKESAKDAAETFIRENPAHPRIDYAWYLKGLIDFEATPIAINRWLGVNIAARPPATARDSFQSLRTLVERFPKSPYAHDARRRMIFLRNRLADYELLIANHYVERGAWVAAAQRARQVIEQYDGAPAVKESLRVLLLCYNKLDYKELADNTERVFRENFPDEPLRTEQSTHRWWKPWGHG